MCDDGGVDKVDDVGAGYLDAVGSVGVVEQADAYAVLLDDEGVELLSLRLVAVGAEVLHAQGVHHGDGAVDTFSIGVHAMVVACGEDVEAAVNACLQVIVGGAELWIAFVWRAGKCHLEVGDGKVGFLDFGCHQFEDGAIVIGAVGSVC